MDKLKERLYMSRLLAKELSGTIDEAEREELTRWLEASPLHGRELDDLRQALEGSDGEAWRVQRRGEELMAWHWGNFKRRTVRHRAVWVTWSKYAALFLLPLLAGIYFLVNWKEGSPTEMVRQGVIVPGKVKAQLVMADGQRVELERGSDIRIQDSCGTEIEASGNMVIYSGMDTLASATRKMEEHTLIIPRGGEYALQLSDGTRVWLNAGSMLRYPVRFNGKDRRVEMTGEAYFEVAKNSEMPFHVAVNGMDIRVLGTSFNVSAYREKVITTLVEGRVRLEGGDNQVELMPNEQAIWQNNDDAFEVRRVEARAFTSWKDGMFYFEDEELETILENLARWYDVTIFYQVSALKSSRFSVEIKRYECIETILRRISQTGRVQFEVKDRTVSVYE